MKLTEIIEELLETPEGPETGEYRGEFDEGGEWNPKFPCGLIDIVGMKPELRDTSGEVMKKRYSAVIYAADERDSFELAEDIFNNLNGARIEYLGEWGVIESDRIELLGWRGRIKVVQIYLNVKM